MDITHKKGLLVETKMPITSKEFIYKQRSLLSKTNNYRLVSKSSIFESIKFSNYFASKTGLETSLRAKTYPKRGLLSRKWPYKSGVLYRS